MSVECGVWSDMDAPLWMIKEVDIIWQAQK